MILEAQHPESSPSRATLDKRETPPLKSRCNPGLIIANQLESALNVVDPITILSTVQVKPLSAVVRSPVALFNERVWL